MKDDIVIVSGARTAVGSFNGVFSTLPAHDLGTIAIKANNSTSRNVSLDPNTPLFNLRRSVTS